MTLLACSLFSSRQPLSSRSRYRLSPSGILIFAWLTAGGIGLGLVVGWSSSYIERRINDGPIEITLSILVPYAVYLAAEEVHASGVLAVVACGLFLSRRSATVLLAFGSHPDLVRLASR